jgi:ADP-heptose:LPS heptosyltransferase
VTRLWRDARADEPIPALFLRRLSEEGLVDPSDGDVKPVLRLSDAERRAGQVVMESVGLRPDRTIVFNPNAGVSIKSWSDASFVELGRRLCDEGYDVAVVADVDRPARASLVNAISGACALPRMTLRQVGAAMAAASAVVSGDSGVAHLAAAVGVPVVAIYGPTWFGRYGVAPPSVSLQSPFACPERIPMNFTVQRCWAADRCVFSDKRSCCDDVDVTMVHRAIHELLQSGRQRRSDA